MFRELGQQMGMQTTRAIYPEDIDIALNTAINEKIRSVMDENLGVVAVTDRVLSNGLGISSINALRTLYTTNTISNDDITGDGTGVNPYSFDIANENIFVILGFQVAYDNNRVYDARIVEHDKLGQTINDFCNRPTRDAPIIVTYGDVDDIHCQVYTGLVTPTKPNSVKYLFIRMPAVVRYDEETPDNNVDCDLPVYLHKEIVLNAVRIYVGSVGAIPNDNRRTVNTNTNPNN